MSWREDLRNASFTGIPFHVETLAGEFGRRAVIYEFPYHEKPWAEDMGKRSRAFSISAYLIGDDYLAEKKALITAIEAEGAGQLVLPTDEPLVVQAGPCVYQYVMLDGGIERVTLEFQEVGNEPFPHEGISFDATKILKGEALEQLKTLEAEGLDDSSVLKKLQEQIQAFADQIYSALDLSDLVDDNAFFSTFQEVVNLADTAFTTYETVVNKIDAIINYLDRGIQKLYRFGALSEPNFKSLFNLLPETIASNRHKNKNGIVFTSTVRALALSQGAVNLVSQVNESALQSSFSRQQVLEQTQEISHHINEEIIFAGDHGLDPLYDALVSFKAGFVKQMNDISLRLKESQYIVLATPQPALVVAYEYHQDANKESEIVTRNGVRNPLFVAAQTDLEVLL